MRQEGRMRGEYRAKSIVFALIWCVVLLTVVACPRDATSPGGDDPVSIQLSILTDTSASFHASWQKPDVPDSLTYLWETVGPGWNLVDTTAALFADFTVPRAASPTQADFCVRSRRVLDDVTGDPVCASFIVPGNVPPPPPDSLEITMGWDGVTPVYTGMEMVAWVYGDYLPEVEQWIKSVGVAGSWVPQEPAPVTWAAPLGTDSLPPSPHYACETRYTMTGDPARPANSGPWQDGGYWNCRYDVGDPYFGAWWMFPRLEQPYTAYARLDGYDMNGDLVAAWAGTFNIKERV